ncbi:MAG: MgtC/SapB family protein [Acidimicrobiia bacterium]|nr:MgtC/SapB family protein [Acidimicrobiia bacterium]
MADIEIVGRLLLAAFCAAVIGVERESAQKVAGFRTHILVGVGAAVFTIVSIDGFGEGDPARVAAQVVTGVGFLGAGAIFKEGATVKGLTTAAGLWAVAAVGVAAGAGSVVLSLSSTFLVVFVLVGFHQFDRYMARQKREEQEQIEVHLDDTKQLQPLIKFAAKIDPDSEQIAFRRDGETGGVLVLGVARLQAPMLAEMLAAHKGVVSAEQLSALYWIRRDE